MSDSAPTGLLLMAADVISAYVSNNSVRLPSYLRSSFECMAR